MLNVEDIRALVAELAPRIVGGQAQKVREPDAATVVISTRVPGRTTHLVISAMGGASRIAESESTTGTLPIPSALGGWLRLNLKGRAIRGMRQVSGDRIVILEFDQGSLVAELTGRSANLFALDPDNRIKAMARQARGDERSPGGIWVAPPPRELRDAAPRFESALAVEAAAQAKLSEAAETQSSAEHGRLLRWARKRLSRLIRKLGSDIERMEAGSDAQRYGELLKSHLHAFKRGDDSVEVTDWYADATPEGLPKVSVPLDPKLDPQGNVERYFRLHRKAQTGLSMASERREEARKRLGKLADAESLDVEGLKNRLKQIGLRPPVPGKGPSRKSDAPRKPFHPWKTRRGEAIWVGRGGADNHLLTFKHARGNDIWLHVRDCPGAHVILPLRGQAEPHHEALLDAAALAATYSDLKDEAAVEVTWTRRKHVRAVKGAGPGRVTIAAGKTVTVERPAERVARLERVD